MGSGNRIVQIQILKNKALIADKCHVAECFVDRLRGLIGRTGLEAGQGMLFPKCNNIHMWFMKFSIDVVFIRNKKSNDGTVVRTVSSVHEGVRAWRIFPLMDWRAQDTLELPVGTIRRLAVTEGDEVCIS